MFSAKLDCELHEGTHKYTDISQVKKPMNSISQTLREFSWSIENLFSVNHNIIYFGLIIPFILFEWIIDKMRKW